jgi:RNA polymerase sigma factor (sigma-70 family)
MLHAELERELLLRAKAGDYEARNQLVLSHLPMVKALRRKAYPTELRLDVESQAVLGLITAVEKFNPDKHTTRFSTYARWWIREKVGSYVRRNTFSVQMGSGTKARRVYAQFDRLNRELGEPGWEVLAEKLGVQVEMLQQFAQAKNMKAAPAEDLEDPTEVTFEAIDEQNHKDRVVAEALLMLPPEWRRVLQRRVFNVHPTSTTDLAEEMGVTVSRISAIEKKAQARLVEYAREIARMDGVYA